MTFTTRCEFAKGRIDPAPMVDVVFLLLIFLVLSSPFVLQPGFGIVDLPKSPIPQNVSFKGLVVTVSRFRITERQVLLLIMAASILAYIAAIFVVTYRQKGQQPDLSRPARVRWMNPQAAQRAPDIRYIIADLLDPSLMSLPNAHGFS